MSTSLQSTFYFDKEPFCRIIKIWDAHTVEVKYHLVEDIMSYNYTLYQINERTGKATMLWKAIRHGYFNKKYFFKGANTENVDKTLGMLRINFFSLFTASSSFDKSSSLKLKWRKVRILPFQKLHAIPSNDFLWNPKIDSPLVELNKTSKFFFEGNLTLCIPKVIVLDPSLYGKEEHLETFLLMSALIAQININ